MVEALQNDLNQVCSLMAQGPRSKCFHQDGYIVLPGGFSYGDYLRCGTICRSSPMMQEVVKFAGKEVKCLGVL